MVNVKNKTKLKNQRSEGQLWTEYFSVNYKVSLRFKRQLLKCSCEILLLIFACSALGGPRSTVCMHVGQTLYHWAISPATPPPFLKFCQDLSKFPSLLNLTHFIVEAGFEPAVLLTWPPGSWNYRSVLWNPAIYFEPREKIISND